MQGHRLISAEVAPQLSAAVFHGAGYRFALLLQVLPNLDAVSPIKMDRVEGDERAAHANRKYQVLHDAPSVVSNLSAGQE
jgi:hypothetical protein